MFSSILIFDNITTVIPELNKETLVIKCTLKIFQKGTEFKFFHYYPLFPLFNDDMAYSLLSHNLGKDFVLHVVSS